ncbi:hypothetical protein H257_19438 [Aphanomyces astaci]|uniref:Crinkler effector protein N-terminal domain-containing protein n=2 Tax=Aphanomyces astaci TaxID=112090 RepID=W4F860_APHAT|nr:hypothetical protein H257_19438 [Aphanomyces astaci]ETV63632.1 hypothetical protein H257_19438 [Aphanomyces astaci]|eukprot:XP_009846884.1 hypothetical protein H257_19438 [Aphanomyces astaci]
MPTLLCFVVGTGRFFYVQITPSQTVGDLRAKIKHENPNTITCDENDLDLYCVVGLVRQGWYLQHNGKPIDMTETSLKAYASKTKIFATSRISLWFNSAKTSHRGTVHVLVGLDAKARRWTALNDALARHSLLKPFHGVELSAPYSTVEWGVVRAVFRECTATTTFPRVPLAHSRMDALAAGMEVVTDAHGRVDVESKEVTRVVFIDQIFSHVGRIVGVQLESHGEVDGKRIKVHGQSDLVLRRGTQRMDIVEAKKNNMDQGMSQCLLGCEALADTENLDVVYGFVTNYLSWLIFKRQNSEILTMAATIQLDGNNYPTRESLQLVAETIHGILLMR